MSCLVRVKLRISETIFLYSVHLIVLQKQVAAATDPDQDLRIEDASPDRERVDTFRHL